MSEDLIPIVLFLVIGGALIARSYFRYKATKEQQLTIRELLTRDQNVSPEVLDALLEAQVPSSQADLRRGLIGLMLGIALAVFALVLGEPDAQRPLLGLAAFPILVGVAYIGLWWFNRSND